jgi:hypothetical protein
MVNNEKPSSSFNTAAQAQDREGYYWMLCVELGEKRCLFCLLVGLPDHAFGD